MKQRFRTLAAVLLLSAVGAAHAAPSCRNDIRSTAPDSRFADNGNGTVSDAATGLVWKQCAEGLSGAGCLTGGVSGLTWQQALQGAADATFAGQTDWRLPNKNELESLVERRCYGPAINVRFFPNTPSNVFWSSSPGANYYSDYAWVVDFYYGNVVYHYRYYALYVRLVRGGQ
ncbi:MAG: DUF1566 domain-containing protein [Chromatiaceae bacterium]|nr:DUF1566 domain-containing protein [Chromatiaceae bacterium]MBP6807331.1 DUF1566 domain-containing protein [Chromatiaceae bacterium]MBP8283043.1 DUF1566 domain-containing protein [Chromatiaceae bacterium]MBP8289449.1 DUF1566 domain-containing protein [Chromatiaceae bacterium]MBP9602884.1 DUF1566 domain-containing protein [Chromatiaceae bacterium]